MTPQSDGSLRGVQTTTVLTNECGLAGSVIEVPFTAVRIGEVPAGVELADPAAVGPPPPPAPTPPAPPLIFTILIGRGCEYPSGCAHVPLLVTTATREYGIAGAGICEIPIRLSPLLK